MGRERGRQCQGQVADVAGTADTGLDRHASLLTGRRPRQNQLMSPPQLPKGSGSHDPHPGTAWAGPIHAASISLSRDSVLTRRASPPSRSTMAKTSKGPGPYMENRPRANAIRGCRQRACSPGSETAWPMREAEIMRGRFLGVRPPGPGFLGLPGRERGPPRLGRPIAQTLVNLSMGGRWPPAAPGRRARGSDPAARASAGRRGSPGGRQRVGLGTADAGLDVRDGHLLLTAWAGKPSTTRAGPWGRKEGADGPGEGASVRPGRKPGRLRVHAGLLRPAAPAEPDRPHHRPARLVGGADGGVGPGCFASLRTLNITISSATFPRSAGAESPAPSTILVICSASLADAVGENE